MQKDLGYRPPVSLADMFGTDDYEIFEQKEQAEGYVAGTIHAQNLQKMLIDEYRGRSRAFMEAVATAIREQL